MVSLVSNLDFTLTRRFRYAGHRAAISEEEKITIKANENAELLLFDSA